MRRRIAAGLAGAPKYIGSDVPRASEVAGFVCRTTASIAAFIEHGYQESLALVEQHKTVVVAIAQALIDHLKRTLDGAEIDAVIVPALAAKAAADERRRAEWAKVLENAAASQHDWKLTPRMGNRDADVSLRTSGIGGQADVV